MMIRVIVVKCVKIENFKNINMHVFIPNPHLVKGGDYLRGRKFIEGIL